MKELLPVQLFKMILSALHVKGKDVDVVLLIVPVCYL